MSNDIKENLSMPSGDSQRVGLRVAAILLFVSAGFMLVGQALSQSQGQAGSHPSNLPMIANIFIGIGLLRKQGFMRMSQEGYRKWAIVRFIAGPIWYILEVLGTQEAKEYPILGLEIIIAAGFLMLLLKQPASPKRVIFGATISVLGFMGGILVLLGASIGAEAFRDFALQAALRTEALPSRDFLDTRSGVKINLPAGWLLLPTDTKLVTVQGAKAIFAHPETSQIVVLLSENVPNSALSRAEQSTSTLDHYLDLVIKARRSVVPDIHESERREARCGPLLARRVSLTWTENAQRRNGFTTVCDDSWEYWLLTAAVFSSDLTQALITFKQLENSFTLTKDNETRIHELVTSVVDLSPWVSIESAELIAREVQRRRLNDTEAGAFGHGLMQKGRLLLKPSDQQALDALFATALSALPHTEYNELTQLQQMVSEGRVLSLEESQRAAKLLQRAIASLQPTQRTRFQNLGTKALKAALARADSK